MVMEMHISRALLDAILADVALDPASERCGLLLGVRGGGRARCLAIQPAANVHGDPQRYFEIDPAVLIAAERDARGGGHAVIGYYHSHPVGPATPSVHDGAAAAADGRYWLIVAGAGYALWRSAAAGTMHGRFDTARLVMEPAAHHPLASPPPPS